MSCARCEPWMQTIPIRTKGDLLDIGRSLREFVEAGDMRELFDGTFICYEPLSIAHLMHEDYAFPDLLYCYLACSACGQRFTLVCETSHGSGGQWSPDA